MEWSTEFRITGDVTITTDFGDPVPDLAKCDYCGRFGALGNCEGCGAPNRPHNLIEITAFGDTKRRFVEGLS